MSHAAIRQRLMHAMELRGDAADAANSVVLAIDGLGLVALVISEQLDRVIELLELEREEARGRD